MRRADDFEIDPQIAAELDAIDATLAGEPVDPRHAELAELALLMAAERPRPDAAFAMELDERVARRFAEPALSGERERAPFRRSGWFAPLAGLATAGVAALVAVVVLSSGAGQRPAVRTSSSAAGSARASGSISRPSALGALATGVMPAFKANGTGTTVLPPEPLPNGRKLVTSAQLALSASPSRVETVAGEVYGVVGREKGIVNSSQVTSGAPGYAQFQLSVPSSALSPTMTSLSQLKYSTVSSRTDATQDVNGEYLSDQRRLADARALRTSLLKQLANATSQTQIDSLRAQLRDAEASIRSDESTLRDLNHKIDFSQILVTINTAAPPVVAHHSSGSFTLGRAAHDAGRVLTVAAGVVLIALAAAVPIALITALGWWIATAVRRRRREQALDLA